MDLNQNIQSKLAVRIAQLELANITLQVQIEQLQKQLEDKENDEK